MTVRLDVVLVRPKEDGNVGAVARLARNFGADRLVLVAPRRRSGSRPTDGPWEASPSCEGGESSRPSVDAVREADLVVGTTDMSTGRSNCAYLRRSVSPERLGEMLLPLTGRVALVFGPEDNGLSRTELARCDLLVHIPARREFPTLNLSHAAAIVLYAVHRARGPARPRNDAGSGGDRAERDGKGAVSEAGRGASGAFRAIPRTNDGFNPPASSVS